MMNFEELNKALKKVNLSSFAEYTAYDLDVKSAYFQVDEDFNIECLTVNHEQQYKAHQIKFAPLAAEFECVFQVYRSIETEIEFQMYLIPDADAVIIYGEGYDTRILPDADHQIDEIKREPETILPIKNLKTLLDLDGNYNSVVVPDEIDEPNYLKHLLEEANIEFKVFNDGIFADTDFETLRKLHAEFMSDFED